MFQYSVYPSAIYTIVFAASFGCWFLFEVWVFSRDRGQGQKGSVGSRGAFLVPLVIGITLAVNAPAVLPAWDIRFHFPIFFALGIALIWAGLLFRAWAIHALGNLFSTDLVVQEHHQLITRGPYRYIRNPSYTGGLSTFIGIGLGIGNLAGLVILLGMGLLLYVRRIRLEDAMLQQAFGQTYAEYRKKTWAVIPFIW